MLRKAVTLLVVLPLAAVFIAFAVANRQITTVSFDPFSAANPAFSATLPLFILVFVLVTLGVVIGGSASWLRQAKWRRTARKLDAENRRLLQELNVARERLADEANRAAAAAEATRAAEANRAEALRLPPAPAPVPAISPPPI